MHVLVGFECNTQDTPTKFLKVKECTACVAVHVKCSFVVFVVGLVVPCHPTLFLLFFVSGRIDPNRPVVIDAAACKSTKAICTSGAIFNKGTRTTQTQTRFLQRCKKPKRFVKSLRYVVVVGPPWGAPNAVKNPRCIVHVKLTGAHSHAHTNKQCIRKPTIMNGELTGGMLGNTPNKPLYPKRKGRGKNSSFYLFFYLLGPCLKGGTIPNCKHMKIHCCFFLVMYCVAPCAVCAATLLQRWRQQTTKTPAP